MYIAECGVKRKGHLIHFNNKLHNEEKRIADG